LDARQKENLKFVIFFSYFLPYHVICTKQDKEQIWKCSCQLPSKGQDQGQ